MNFMKVALEEAMVARELDEVPVGAVIVKDGQVVARGHNLRENTKDATMHAEIVAIRQACEKIGDWRLEDCDIYVTLEPCPMCMGAILNSRVARVYYGAYDIKWGACGSRYDLREGCYHKVEVTGGVLNEQCAKILGDYFKEKR